MSFQINPITDIPHEDAKLLGHERIVTNLKTFLEKDNMITPLSIAIHGDWGSGKTSIMKTLSKNLNNNQFEVIFFEAWKYEYANPSLGLIVRIEDWKSIKDVLTKFVDSNLIIKHGSKLADFFTISHKITVDYKITADILNKDFEILYSATNEALR